MFFKKKLKIFYLVTEFVQNAIRIGRLKYHIIQTYQTYTFDSTKKWSKMNVIFFVFGNCLKSVKGLCTLTSSGWYLAHTFFKKKIIIWIIQIVLLFSADHSNLINFTGLFFVIVRYRFHHSLELNAHSGRITSNLFLVIHDHRGYVVSPLDYSLSMLSAAHTIQHIQIETRTL